MNSSRMMDETIKLSAEAIGHESNETLKNNLNLMPDFLNPMVFSENSLFTLYREAYLLVAFGFYNAALIIMGELLEVSVREIIKIKTGGEIRMTFNDMIRFARKKSLMDVYDLNFIDRFRTKIRNPYTHWDLKKIAEKMTIPVWKIPITGDDPREFLATIDKVREKIKKKKIKPEIINLCEYPDLAAIVKQDPIDRMYAIDWSWKVFLQFEWLLKLYLQRKDYEMYLSKFGSPYDRIPRVDEND